MLARGSELVLCAAIAIGLGCEAEPKQVAWLRVTQVRPQNHVGVFLNEKIQLDFSEPLDPTSVDRSSVRITAEDGTPARGDLRVDEDRLVFVPDPVLAFDLSDGGYRPGTTYFVDLPGFPLVNGLRSRGGATLERNQRWQFRTVEVTPSDQRTGFVFEDSSPERGLRVVLRSTTIAPGDPIVLEGEEPFDPSTLFGEDFVLQRELVEDQAPGRTRPPLSAPIALLARVVQNYDRSDPLAPSGRTARIELVPLDRLLEPGRYWLNVDADKLRLRDFGGNRVKIWARDPPASSRLEFNVAPRATGPEIASWFLESFSDPHRRSFELPDEFDGTATWNYSGRVEIHWPQAAGDGRDGEVLLGAKESRADVQATRIELAHGTTCVLDPHPGLVVLRAQGKLVIAGDLRRRAHDERAPSDFVSADEGKPFTTAGTLSERLAELRGANFDATVLIAGGDLVIDGRVDCDQPVLLVAGGRIRAARADSIGARGLYYLGEGGLPLVDRNAGPQRKADAIASALVPDEPTVNVLAAPLRMAVVSASIPDEGRAVRWHVGPRVVSNNGMGLARVRYIGERLRPDNLGVREVIVDDPAALADCPTLRLQVELEVPARGENQPWRPPWVDDVLLEFDRALSRDER